MATNPEKQSGWNALVAWATKIALKHPAAPALGILVLVSVLVLSVFAFLGDNTRFVMGLLTLLVVLVSVFFTFSPPPPSPKRGVIGLLLSIATSSICLNVPLPFRDWIVAPKSVTVTAFPADPPRAAASAVPAASAALPASAPERRIVSRSFEVVGPSLNVGCEDSANGNVRFSLPEGATLQASSASWINASNLSSFTASAAQAGRDVIGTGSIRGLARQQIAFGIANCPGGGHASLVLSGSYTVTEAGTR